MKNRESKTVKTASGSRMSDSIIRLFDYSTISRPAFTLIELMLVMAIMGLLGTISIGGFRAMRRGMEERRVGDNVRQFVENAYQRAKIDRQPVAVYFWNETRRAESDTESLLVVGRAVAVRRAGRITATGEEGYLIDEFGDLRYSEELTAGGKSKGGDPNGIKMYLYKMNGTASWSDRIAVSQATRSKNQSVSQMMTDAEWKDRHSNEKIVAYGWYAPDANWDPGDAYGLEFAEITLPNNYIFGSSFNDKTDDPVRDAGSHLYIKSDSSGVSLPDLSAIRPGKDGKPAAQSINY